MNTQTFQTKSANHDILSSCASILDKHFTSTPQTKKEHVDVCLYISSATKHAEPIGVAETTNSIILAGMEDEIVEAIYDACKKHSRLKKIILKTAIILSM